MHRCLGLNQRIVVLLPLRLAQFVRYFLTTMRVRAQPGIDRIAASVLNILPVLLGCRLACLGLDERIGRLLHLELSVSLYR